MPNYDQLANQILAANDPALLKHHVFSSLTLADQLNRERNNNLHANAFISCSIWRLASFLADTSCPFEEMDWQCCPEPECRKQLPNVDKDKKTTCWRMWANVRKDGVAQENEAVMAAHRFLYDPANNVAQMFMTQDEQVRVGNVQPPAQTNIKDCGCKKGPNTPPAG